MNWCVAEFNFEHEPSRSEVITHTAILSGNKNLNSVRMNKTLPSPLPLSLLPIHCGRRGSGSQYQLYEHLFSLPGASNYRPTIGHKMVSSDLDFLLNSTPF